jgi:hypothetical protein
MADNPAMGTEIAVHKVARLLRVAIHFRVRRAFGAPCGTKADTRDQVSSASKFHKF